MMINKIDSTRFEVDLLDMYRTLIKAFIYNQMKNYTAADMGQLQQHWFDILFLTPSNMASDFYKTDFFISTLILDGLEVKERQDIDGTSQTDVTNIDDQIFFTFED